VDIVTTMLNSKID